MTTLVEAGPAVNAARYLTRESLIRPTTTLFIMAYRRRRSRRFRRSKSTARRALHLARAVSRKVAGEVKKFDTTALIS